MEVEVKGLMKQKIKYMIFAVLLSLIIGFLYNRIVIPDSYRKELFLYKDSIKLPNSKYINKTYIIPYKETLRLKIVSSYRQKTIIFNNKIHVLITGRETKNENQLILEAGKPMIFGKEKNKGIVLEGTRLKAVVIGENGVTEDDILVHDPTTEDAGIHMMLASMAPPELPAALGVIRAVKAETLEDAVWNSVEHEKEVSPYKNVDDLLTSGNTWKIE